jgi:hypothetical protein
MSLLKQEDRLVETSTCNIETSWIQINQQYVKDRITILAANLLTLGIFVGNILLQA